MVDEQWISLHDATKLHCLRPYHIKLGNSARFSIRVALVSSLIQIRVLGIGVRELNSM